MAVGWMSALKLVPWGDVIEATPQIMQAARKLIACMAAMGFSWGRRPRRPRSGSTARPINWRYCKRGWPSWRKTSARPPR